MRGNSPVPAQVSPNDSLVKCELVMPAIDNRSGQPLSQSNERSYGVSLAQLIEDRKLKIEVFPGKSAATVAGFTTGARIYE